MRPPLLEVEVAGLAGLVGGSQRSRGPDDGDRADPEGRLDPEVAGMLMTVPLGEPVVAQRLVERRLRLSGPGAFGRQRRHRLSHAVDALLGPRHGDGLRPTARRTGSGRRPSRSPPGGCAEERDAITWQPRDLVVAQVGRLAAWAQQGVVVRDQLPALAVYLGHVSPQNTYWYLTATPPVLEPASARFEAFVDGKGMP